MGKFTNQFIVACRRCFVNDHRVRSGVVRIGLRASVHGLRPVVDVLQDQTTWPRILSGMEHGRYKRIRRWLDAGQRRCGGCSYRGCSRRLGLRLDQPADTQKNYVKDG